MRNDFEIVTTLRAVDEVRSLPKGAVVGDLYGGRSFNDNVAAALEQRSHSGWRDHEVPTGTDERWTLIVLDR